MEDYNSKYEGAQIDDFLGRIPDVDSTAKEALETATKATENIETHKENSGKKYSNALIGKATGELIHIYTAEAKARKLSIGGNTLVTPTDPQQPISPDNKAILKSAGEHNLWDGTYIDNTAMNYLTGEIYTTSNSRTTNLISCLPNVTYVISGGDRTVTRFTDKDGNYISVSSTSTFTTPSNAINFQCYYSSNGTHTQFMINYGITQSFYTPYRSFNVYKVNNFNNELTNGNFVNTSGWYTRDATNFSVTDNQATFTATAKYGQLNHLLQTIIKDHKYYISAYVSSTDDCTISLAMNDNVGWVAGDNVIATTLTLVSSIGIAKNTTARGFIQINDRRTSNWTPINVSRVMVIDMGTNASHPLYNKTVAEMNALFSTWIEHKEPITVTLKDTDGNYLEPLNSTPDGTRDEIFKDVDGLYKVRRNAPKIVFNGSDGKKVKYSEPLTNVVRAVFKLECDDYADLYCNCLTLDNKYDLDKEHFYVFNNTIRTYINKTRLVQYGFIDGDDTTYNTSVNSYLRENPIEVIYPAKDPKIITLHADTQAQLKELETLQDGETNIFGVDTVSPVFNVEYVKDINKVVEDYDKAITELKLAIISLGGNV